MCYLDYGNLFQGFPVAIAYIKICLNRYSKSHLLILNLFREKVKEIERETQINSSTGKGKIVNE